MPAQFGNVDQRGRRVAQDLCMGEGPGLSRRRRSKWLSTAGNGTSSHDQNLDRKPKLGPRKAENVLRHSGDVTDYDCWQSGQRRPWTGKRHHCESRQEWRNGRDKGSHRWPVANMAGGVRNCKWWIGSAHGPDPPIAKVVHDKAASEAWSPGGKTSSSELARQILDCCLKAGRRGPHCSPEKLLEAGPRKQRRNRRAGPSSRESWRRLSVCSSQALRMPTFNFSASHIRVTSGPGTEAKISSVAITGSASLVAPPTTPRKFLYFPRITLGEAGVALQVSCCRH